MPEFTHHLSKVLSKCYVMVCKSVMYSSHFGPECSPCTG
uniref:Uncharacterized protein n=1 Tax=Anguilla anguilla TaxID=7936 RepID=A0A0E9VI25_ANGAN